MNIDALSYSLQVILGWLAMHLGKPAQLDLTVRRHEGDAIIELTDPKQAQSVPGIAILLRAFQANRANPISSLLA